MSGVHLYPNHRIMHSLHDIFCKRIIFILLRQSFVHFMLIRPEDPISIILPIVEVFLITICEYLPYGQKKVV